jgi:hypothetical protein
MHRHCADRQACACVSEWEGLTPKP